MHSRRCMPGVLSDVMASGIVAKSKKSMAAHDDGAEQAARKAAKKAKKAAKRAAASSESSDTDEPIKVVTRKQRRARTEAK